MKTQIPTINDTCTIKERDPRIDPVLYKIVAIDRELNKASIQRLEYSALYKAIIAAQVHPILRYLEFEIYDVVKDKIAEKFPTCKWEYEEKEKYTVSLDAVEPIGETYTKLIEEVS